MHRGKIVIPPSHPFLRRARALKQRKGAIQNATDADGWTLVIDKSRRSRPWPLPGAGRRLNRRWGFRPISSMDLFSKVGAGHKESNPRKIPHNYNLTSSPQPQKSGGGRRTKRLEGDSDLRLYTLFVGRAVNTEGSPQKGRLPSAGKMIEPAGGVCNL